MSFCQLGTRDAQLPCCETHTHTHTHTHTQSGCFIQASPCGSVPVTVLYFPWRSHAESFWETVGGRRERREGERERQTDVLQGNGFGSQFRVFCVLNWRLASHRLARGGRANRLVGARPADGGSWESRLSKGSKPWLPAINKSCSREELLHRLWIPTVNEAVGERRPAGFHTVILNARQRRVG